MKLQVRKFIKQDVRRLEITYLVTGPYADLFIGKSKNAEYGTFDVTAEKATLLSTGKEKISFTSMEE